MTAVVIPHNYKSHPKDSPSNKTKQTLGSRQLTGTQEYGLENHTQLFNFFKEKMMKRRKQTGL